MNTRKLVASSLTALMIVAGNAVAAEQAPFPSSAHEVGGHWTGKAGRASTPGNDLAVYPSAGKEFSSIAIDGGFQSGNVARQASPAGHMTAFPSAGREFSSI